MISPISARSPAFLRANGPVHLRHSWQTAYSAAQAVEIVNVARAKPELSPVEAVELYDRERYRMLNDEAGREIVLKTPDGFDISKLIH